MHFQAACALVQGPRRTRFQRAHGASHCHSAGRWFADPIPTPPHPPGCGRRVRAVNVPRPRRATSMLREGLEVVRFERGVRLELDVHVGVGEQRLQLWQDLLARHRSRHKRRCGAECPNGNDAQVGYPVRGHLQRGRQQLGLEHDYRPHQVRLVISQREHRRQKRLFGPRLAIPRRAHGGDRQQPRRGHRGARSSHGTGAARRSRLREAGTRDVAGKRVWETGRGCEAVRRTAWLRGREGGPAGLRARVGGQVLDHRREVLREARRPQLSRELGQELEDDVPDPPVLVAAQPDDQRQQHRLLRLSVQPDHPHERTELQQHSQPDVGELIVRQRTEAGQHELERVGLAERSRQLHHHRRKLHPRHRVCIHRQPRHHREDMRLPERGTQRRRDLGPARRSRDAHLRLVVRLQREIHLLQRHAHVRVQRLPSLFAPFRHLGQRLGRGDAHAPRLVPGANREAVLQQSDARGDLDVLADGRRLLERVDAHRLLLVHQEAAVQLEQLALDHRLAVGGRYPAEPCR
eukprot:scaffold16457_cov109-Isochrysis_galbana.AAC.4